MQRQIITVFGGSGFLGRHLVRRLARQGWTIRVAVRDVEAAGFLKPLGNVGQILPIRANILDPDSVGAALSGATAAVNLVGILYEKSKGDFERIHVRGGETIARSAQNLGLARLVHISALGADAQSKALYAATKAAGEEAVRAAFPNVTILRPSVIFGPEDQFFNTFAAMMLYQPVLPVIGAALLSNTAAHAGGPLFQPVYVGDVADAIGHALTRDSCRGETYSLGGPQVFSFAQLLAKMARVCRREPILLPVPLAAAKALAFFLERLPHPPLTRDQVELLRTDNIIPRGAPGLAELAVTPHALDTILPTYLARFRPPARQRVRTDTGTGTDSGMEVR
ncbi:complex I NDUFA9 subunit family protein [Varunaivibrio sulfuroxidans]|uniref:NADH dehydrogenase n=1 Tax=Varunaivibrio sulfuroxidans TaxID=1773489 RepID=A0A4R3JF58_9PROT|nr:complex I NDUFA9 subunit family protein [Varunaivibrio sulfuroxidans]TCS64749.1 NADH dehydrogenase [Varunaivibrio sulfuroxidans]WES29946.1 complex I NDUFA9 subunit family protein [Varunaivibrio sulfuroxidans]